MLLILLSRDSGPEESRGIVLHTGIDSIGPGKISLCSSNLILERGSNSEDCLQSGLAHTAYPRKDAQGKCDNGSSCK